MNGSECEFIDDLFELSNIEFSLRWVEVLSCWSLFLGKYCWRDISFGFCNGGSTGMGLSTDTGESTVLCWVLLISGMEYIWLLEVTGWL